MNGRLYSLTAANLTAFTTHYSAPFQVKQNDCKFEQNNHFHEK